MFIRGNAFNCTFFQGRLPNLPSLLIESRRARHFPLCRRRTIATCNAGLVRGFTESHREIFGGNQRSWL